MVISNWHLAVNLATKCVEKVCSAFLKLQKNDGAMNLCISHDKMESIYI